MTFKTAILAAVIGLSGVAGTGLSHAAPLGAPSLTTTAGTTAVGYGYRGYGYGYGSYGYRLHGGYRQRQVHYTKRCYEKKVRVWSEYRHGWVYTYETVCHRAAHY